jgi:uncharacterized membrane protein
VRYFLVVLAVFGLLHLPPLARWEWLAFPGNRAALALAIGVFLSGIHHAVFANHFVDLLPERIPGKSGQVYLSAVLRMAFGVGLVFISTRPAATIGTMILLCLVLPVNVRIALQGNTTGQLIAGSWFLWLRLVVHVSWIGWCGWCLSLKSC